MRRICLLACCLIEPVLHALGLPHPEGASVHAANLLAVLDD